MKNLLLIPLVLISLSVKSQSKGSTIEKGPIISFDSATIDTEKNISVFSGNVNYKDSIVEIKNAQQLTLNSNTKELTGIGISEAGIDGTLTITAEENFFPNTLYYKLGSRRLYLNSYCH